MSNVIADYRRHCIERARPLEINFPALRRGARPFVPGEVSVVAGRTGSQKSFLVLNVFNQAFSNGALPCYLPLEGTRWQAMDRILAIREGSWRFLDDQEGDLEAMRYRHRVARENEALVEQLAPGILENPIDSGQAFGAGEAIDLLTREAQPERLVILDNLTAINWGARGFEAQEYFMGQALAVARESKAALVLVAHLSKRRASERGAEVTTDDMAGSSLFSKLAHCVLFVQTYPPREVAVDCGMGAMPKTVTREIAIAKTRGGSAPIGQRIAYGSEGPAWVELGPIVKGGAA